MMSNRERRETDKNCTDDRTCLSLSSCLSSCESSHHGAGRTGASEQDARAVRAIPARDARGDQAHHARDAGHRGSSAASLRPSLTFVAAAKIALSSTSLRTIAVLGDFCCVADGYCR